MSNDGNAEDVEMAMLGTGGIEEGAMAPGSDANKPQDACQVEIKMKSETKCDVRAEDRFTGLTKEQLLEAANTPGWKFVRMFLYIFCGLVWLGMLATAIVMVVLAPRCAPVPQPNWYEATALYQADPQLFASGYRGMSDHLNYVKNLQASLLLSGVVADNKLNLAVGDEPAFQHLIAQAHKQGIKVVVELPAASFPIRNGSELNSAENLVDCADGHGKRMCKLIKISDQNSQGMNPINMEPVFFYHGNNQTAYINYNSTLAHLYISGVVQVWLSRGVDGFYLSDVPQVAAATHDEVKLVDTVWNKINQLKNGTEKNYALFVAGTSRLQARYSSGVGQNSSVYGSGLHPILVSTIRADSIGADLERARNTSRSVIASRMVNDSPDLRNQSFAATLLHLALPTVPILQSGLELGLPRVGESFQWNKKQPSRHQPSVVDDDVARKLALEQTRNLLKRKNHVTLSLKSLRFDTRSSKTRFVIYQTGDSLLVAICRKWANEKAVLVIGNLSSVKKTLKIDYKTCDKNLLSTAKVIASSNVKLNKNKKFVLKNKVEIAAYTTLILTS